MSTTTLSQSQAVHLANDHYENFPVSPFFLPRAFRKPIALIYAFARVADDIADEGDLTDSERLNQLQHMHDRLPDGRHCKQAEGFFVPLNQMIAEHKLPVQLFHDLLDAFMQDVVKSTYQNFDDVLDYCRRSANPIGRLLLHLTQEDTHQNLKLSDDICTALQLINFLQDWHSDLHQRDRVYIPIDDLTSCGLSVLDLRKNLPPKQVEPLLETQWQRAYDLLTKGAPLTKNLKGRFGFNIRLTVWGGATILNKCANRKRPTDRPTLSKLDWLVVLTKSLIGKAIS